MPEAPERLLEVEGLSVDYGAARAVDDLSLSVAAGSIVTMIGSNGAGKTTTLAALMGLLAAHGTVRFAGRSILDLDVASRVALHLTLVPETRELFAEMTVEENLLLGAFRRYRCGERGFAADFAGIYDLFPPLGKRSRQLAGTLSGGERQMLAIGRALMSKPRLLMLDEPSLGLAPLIVAEIFSIIADLRRAGVAILLVEQNATAALKIADHAYVIESGRIVLEGAADEIANDPRVEATYLGIGESAGTIAPARRSAGDGSAVLQSSLTTGRESWESF